MSTISGGPMASFTTSRLREALKPRPLSRRDNERPLPRLVREETGVHVSISPDLPEAARHSASVFGQTYAKWLQRDRYNAWGRYKREHFVVAVGGGNTLKAQYAAMASLLHSQVDWLNHIRFFPLEASTGEEGRESPLASLRENLLVPLAVAITRAKGRRQLLKLLDLPSGRPGRRCRAPVCTDGDRYRPAGGKECAGCGQPVAR
ncbi:MAG: hypothetical protein ACPG1A_06075, partial [Halioglobus sp.]